MTIQIPDVLVTLHEHSSSHAWPIPDKDDYLCLPRKPLADASSLDKPQYDDDSCTLSTTSLSDFSDVESVDDEDSCPRVSFAEDLVTDTWSRPYTEVEDIPDLFYSASEIEKFRQDYRMERKLLSSLDEPTAKEDHDVDLTSLLEQPRSSRSISKVVVLHNDKLETFCSEDLFFDTPEFWSGSITWW